MNIFQKIGDDIKEAFEALTNPAVRELRNARQIEQDVAALSPESRSAYDKFLSLATSADWQVVPENHGRFYCCTQGGLQYELVESYPPNDLKVPIVVRGAVIRKDPNEVGAPMPFSNALVDNLIERVLSRQHDMNREV